MLDALRAFVHRLSNPGPERHFSADDIRLAVAALLVHCTAVDGTVTETERAKLRDVLGRTFGLSGANLQLLIDDAIAADEDAVDLYRFTSVLKRNLSEPERIRVVESLWEVVFADGRSHEFEDNLIWRTAELLGVDARDRVLARQAAAQHRSPDPAAAG